MSWWEPSTPDTIVPLPWLHPAATSYLDALLTGDMCVTEHGCGGSTLWFAARVRSVTAFDCNREWMDAVLRRGLRNVTVYDDRIYFISPDCDLLFIDGNNRERPLWILSAARMKPGSVVVVDNAERPHYQEALSELRKRCHAPTVITAWTGHGKRVETHFYRIAGGVTWI